MKITKPTKKQLIKAIDELKKNPEDKVRILGDIGITAVGIGLGAAAAGTIAAAAGVTSIYGLTTAASWVGITVVSATPVGWAIGVAAVGGAAAYGVSRLIHNGGMSEGQKQEHRKIYEDQLRDIEAKERSDSITAEDKNKFTISLRDLIDKDAISPEDAKDLIEKVETGKIKISKAINHIQNILNE